MFDLKTALWKVRIIGFFRDTGILVAFTVVGVLNSPQFMDILNEHLGGTVLGSMVILGITGFASHLWNIKTIKKAKEKFGAEGPREPIVLI